MTVNPASEGGVGGGGGGGGGASGSAVVSSAPGNTHPVGSWLVWGPSELSVGHQPTKYKPVAASGGRLTVLA